MTVAHVTTVHHRADTRIRVKEVASLAEALGAVTLLVQDGRGSDPSASRGVRLVDTGPRPRSRLARMTLGSWEMWRAIRALRPSVVHFHDPELILVGMLAKAAGMKVVYDVHEDVPRQILSKDWIPGLLRVPVACAVEGVEWVAARVFDAIVPATPRIALRFPGARTVVVQNFPIAEELSPVDALPYAERPPAVAYVGDIADVRGARQMVGAMARLPRELDCRLELAGGFSPPELQSELMAHPGWRRVRYHGWAARAEVASILGSARAGLVLLHPIPNYTEAYPNKMFEYMAAGLPVIASDFPLWREIVRDSGAGLLVDPLDPQAMAEAVQWLLEHPQEAEAMGRCGRQAVAERFNWRQEEKKLIALYERLLPAGDREPQQGARR